MGGGMRMIFGFQSLNSSEEIQVERESQSFKVGFSKTERGETRKNAQWECVMYSLLRAGVSKVWI